MDWERYVRERLPLSHLPPARAEEIVAELAQQLEQAARAGRDPEAEIPDWPALARKIEHSVASPVSRLLWGSDLARDLRHALATWRRAPGFAVIAVLTLALGIGANTAMFSWVNAELLQALPDAHPSRLMVLQEWSHGRRVAVCYPDYLDWRQDNHRQNGSFSSLAWIGWLHLDVGGAGSPEVVPAAYVSANYFSTLGVPPVLGRSFSPGADTGAAKHELVASWGLATRRFGAASRALGQPLNLDQAATYTIVGVLPPQFRTAQQTELFAPIGVDLKDNTDRGDRGDGAVIGRLTPGASFEQAAAQMRTEQARLDRAYPGTDQGIGSTIAPLRSLFVAGDAAMLWLMFAAVGLVLLIACANVANLTLTRTAVRQQEWGVRAALGAGRGRLIRQLLTESLALGTAGVAIGLLVAEAGMHGLAALMPVAGNEIVPLGLGWPVLAFTAAVALLVVVLTGLGPALTAPRLQWSGRGSASLGWRHRREVLLIAEVALALILTAAAGLTLKSFARLMAVNPGFQPAHVLTLDRRLAGPRYASDTTRLQFEQQALVKMSALPGVEIAGVGTDLPLTGDHSRNDVSIVGRPTPERGHYPHPDFHFISPGYLPALG
ncbi:MAG: ABC transporter permease, partial [Terriglobales bacterium]